MNRYGLKIWDKVKEESVEGIKKGEIVSLPPINHEIAIIDAGQKFYMAVICKNCKIIS